MKSINVGVVIPFYQKKSGLLLNALASIFKQSAQGINFLITIVDDGSPISAKSEISEIKLPKNCTLKLILQKNQGPAAARNKAIDYLYGQDIEFLAFLDSDDCWMDFHISNAMKALSIQDVDFYFSDHSRFDSEHSLFNETGCFKDLDKAVCKYNIHLEDDFAMLTGKSCFSLFLNYYISQTSSVVYNFDKLKNHRFDESLVSAGEDYFLWLELAHSSSKVVFSFNKGVYCGRGVNIFFDSFDWGKLASSTRIGYETLFYRKIYSFFELNSIEKNKVKSNYSRLEEQFSYLMVKHFITGKGLDKVLLNRIYKVSPRTLILLPFRFLNYFIKSKN
ncbi:glycosyltransferase family A protein [Pseudoalteromonas carrageenovora]|uniref:glycosyltransferase family A protein n=1 Tax=Pseudoalteromonas carrageenovora TaxID=227 RepID=UPI0026E295B4|nr:glycosyltransferase family 2 protein [Pseudoalteromonas carrageenovora]MDO6463896.1 glycosyltransferase family 2 protein [Pseudoalteromonas carrageenovora]